MLELEGWRSSNGWDVVALQSLMEPGARWLSGRCINAAVVLPH